MKKITQNNLIYLLIILFLIVILLFVSSREGLKNSNKYVCLYAYYEKDNIYKENLKYFLENGYREDIDYYIIINGKCTVDIPKKNNISVEYRDNIGFDFAGWSYGIKKLKKEYDYYIFLNSSVRGPYRTTWLEDFLSLFNKPDIKLVGTSINVSFGKWLGTKPPYTHVQSMFFILEKEGFKYLIDNNFFNEEEINKMDFGELIRKKEVGMSQMILKNNWNINSILDKYKGIDYRTLRTQINPTSIDGDPYFEGAYFGKNITPDEAIFFKSNRGLRM